MGQKRKERDRENTSTFTFMHLADIFIQSDLHSINAIQVIHCYCQYVCSLGIEPTTVYAANAIIYDRATGTLVLLAWTRVTQRETLMECCALLKNSI